MIITSGWGTPANYKKNMSVLTELYKEIGVCRRCGLYKTATRAVPGEGPEDARILFIGEGPGRNEDLQGRPFVGAAGKFLDQLINSIGLKREQVYITNVVKHRPPENRDPLPSEISACSIWLDRQIELINPRIIVTLGRHSMARYFPNKSISKIHGTYEKRNGIFYFAMYHPAAALHQERLRQEIERDMLKIGELLVDLRDPPKENEKPQQLNLF
ncbi:MAG: uracil-DNA glycosylase [Dehalococcoidales bacterium]|nr:uracil-DNA glycosylase [Dehalococcoidales bacterium]